MRTITHRELRNNSSQVLKAVQGGELIEVTNRGEVAAVLVPPSLSPYERLVAAGKVRRALGKAPDLRKVRRSPAGLSTEEILRDVRGER